MAQLLSRRSFLASSAVSAAALSVAGSPFAARLAWAAEKTVIQLGWIANVEYMGMFIADRNGIQRPAGV